MDHRKKTAPRPPRRDPAAGAPGAQKQVQRPRQDDHPTLLAASTPDDPPIQSLYAGPARPFRCGGVTLAGVPNAGKSTLLNRLLGEKISIVSPKPQTTRDQIRGIWTGADMQAIFIDTPGIHRARSPLNRAMVGLAIEALETVDVVVLVVDAPMAVKWAERAAKREAWRLAHTDEAAAADAEADAEDAEDVAEEPAADSGKQPRITLDPRIPPGDGHVIRNILRYNRRWMVALNKVDLVRPSRLLPVMQGLGTAPGVGPIVPISARSGDGLAQLLESIRTYLPEQEAEFAADELTDRSLRFLCAEFVREQVFLQTREEVPYGVACEVELWEELPDLTHVQVLVHVEKQAQRGILVGAAGSRMKQMATAARLQMERLLERKVFLEVHVHIEERWSERIEKLKQFGYIL